MATIVSGRLPFLCFARLLRCPTQIPMTYIDKMEHDSDWRADRYNSPDVVANIY